MTLPGRSSRQRQAQILAALYDESPYGLTVAQAAKRTGLTSRAVSGAMRALCGKGIAEAGPGVTRSARPRYWLGWGPREVLRLAGFVPIPHKPPL